MKRAILIFVCVLSFFVVSIAQGDTVTVTNSVPEGYVLNGCILWTVTINPSTSVDRVDFIIDGSFASSDFSSPYEYLLHTANIPNGPNILTSEAFDATNTLLGRADTNIIAKTGNSHCHP
jgi:hypothetical protein